jgi:hypothetical protein
MRTVRAELAEVSALPLEQGVRALVAMAVAAHRVDPELHRVLAEQIPRVGPLETLELFNRENHTLFRAYLARHRDELRVDDLELASFVCVTSIEALAHNAVLNHAEVFSEGKMDALINQCARMVTGYLMNRDEALSSRPEPRPSTDR